MSDLAAIERNYLLFFVLPLWVASGFADWCLHRKARIARTSGSKESLIHVLMMVELGVPVGLGLFAEANALLRTLAIVGFIMHEATAFWDVTYAEKHREVSALEQHLHSALEMLPLLVMSFLVCMQWEQFCAIFGLGNFSARWHLEWKHQPLSTREQLYALGSVVIFLGIPFAEELVRCARHVSECPTEPAEAATII